MACSFWPVKFFSTMEITRLQTDYSYSFLKDSFEKAYWHCLPFGRCGSISSTTPLGKQVFPKSLKDNETRNHISINQIPWQYIGKKHFRGTTYQEPYFPKLYFHECIFRNCSSRNHIYRNPTSGILISSCIKWLRFYLKFWHFNVWNVSGDKKITYFRVVLGWPRFSLK